MEHAFSFLFVSVQRSKCATVKALEVNGHSGFWQKVSWALCFFWAWLEVFSVVVNEIPEARLESGRFWFARWFDSHNDLIRTWWTVSSARWQHSTASKSWFFGLAFVFWFSFCPLVFNASKTSSKQMTLKIKKLQGTKGNCTDFS